MIRSRRFLLLGLVASAVPGPGPGPAGRAPDGFPLPAGALRRFGNRQLRHPNGITAVAVSPDGKLLATGSYGGPSSSGTSRL